MTLIKTVARMDSEGKITLPRNIQAALGLKEQDAVELKVAGAGKATKVMMAKLSNRR